MRRLRVFPHLGMAEKAAQNLREMYPQIAFEAKEENAGPPSTQDVEKYGTNWATRRDQKDKQGIVFIDDSVSEYEAHEISTRVNPRGEKF